MSNVLVVPRVTTTSDRRDKTNVEHIKNAMYKIEQLTKFIVIIWTVTEASGE